MRLLVLSGGFGTRLKTVLSNVPKALAPVGKVPFLHLQIERWLEQGLREFTFLLHHQADQIITFLQEERDGLLKDSQVDWVIESMPMGTGGAVAHAVNILKLKNDFLLTNVDTWLGSGVNEMIRSKAPTIAVISLPDVSRYGQVYFDNSHRVTSFAEKTQKSAEGWVNAGLSYLDASLFNDWDGQPFSLERNLFPKLIDSRCLTAVPLHTDFIDIGIPDDYHRFCRWVVAGRQTFLCN